jgi:SAM-dependent methyltransferase
MSPSRWSRTDAPRGASYDERFDRLAAAGHDVHGEASFVAGYEPRNVLDAGCGTGRVAIELARRGIAVVGVDNDSAMLRSARDKAPGLPWVLSDLARLDLLDDDGERFRFDAVVCAGNVMIFVQPGFEPEVVARLADHLRPGGLLISGFQLLQGRYSLQDYERDTDAAGLVPYDRFSTWARDRWAGSGGYVVDVCQRPPVEDAGEPEG